MPTVLGIAGSPRKHGNSRLLLHQFLNGANKAGADTRELVLQDLNYEPCRACDGCLRTGTCVVRDDMSTVYSALEEADGVVLAAPVHFGGIGARAKMAIDRCQCFWAAKYRLERPRIAADRGVPGFFICVGGMKPRRFCDNAREVVATWFTVMSIVLVGDLMVREVDEAGEISKRPEDLRRADAAGRLFAARLLPTDTTLGEGS